MFVDGSKELCFGFVSTPLNWYKDIMESHRISTYVGISTRFSTNLQQMSFGCRSTDACCLNESSGIPIT